jgi:hypothetical protein
VTWAGYVTWAGVPAGGRLRFRNAGGAAAAGAKTTRAGACPRLSAAGSPPPAWSADASIFARSLPERLRGYTCVKEHGRYRKISPRYPFDHAGAAGSAAAHRSDVAAARLRERIVFRPESIIP